MMATVKTYDPSCYELAKLFLSDEPGLDSDANARALALEIQQCVEDEIFFMRNEATAKDEAKSEPACRPRGG